LSSIAFLILKIVFGYKYIFVSSETSQATVPTGDLGFDIAAIVISFLASFADLVLFYVTRKAFMSHFAMNVSLYQPINSDEETPKEEPKKDEKSHTSIGRVLKLAIPEKWLLLWGIIALLISSATNLAMPLCSYPSLSFFLPLTSNNHKLIRLRRYLASGNGDYTTIYAAFEDCS